MKTTCFVSYSNPRAVAHILSRDHAAEIIRFYRRRNDVKRLRPGLYEVCGSQISYALLDTKAPA